MQIKQMKAGLLLTMMVAASAVLLQACQKDEVGVPGGGSDDGPSAAQVRNLRQFEELTVNIGALVSEVRSRGASAINVRLEGGTARDLEVMVKAAEPDAQLFVDDVPQPMPEIFTLTGFRRGTSEPCVITLAEGWFSAVFKENGEDYFVQARKDFDPAAGDDQFVIYRAQDVIDPGPTMCGSDATDGISIPEHDEVEQGDRSTCKKVKMTVVADPQFRDDYSSNANCLAAMTTQINNASYCYWHNTTLLLDMTVSKNYIYTSSSSFTSSVSSTLLGQLRTWGNASSSRRSDLNYLFTGKDLESNVVGRGYLGVACYNPTYAYAIGMKMSTTAYWRNLIAHETGHNFNASHATSGIMLDHVTNANSFNSTSKTAIQSFTNAHNCYTTGTCN